MKKLLTTLALSLSISVSAGTFTTGGKTGNYFKVGTNFSKVIPDTKVITSKGSIENLNRIASGEADFGITQADALAYWKQNNPDKESHVEVLGPLYQECAYVAVNKNGKVQSEDDLEKEGVTIAVGAQGSGTAVSWDYMRRLEQGYKKASVSFTGGVRALGKLASSPDGDVNAVMWITRPTLNGKLLSTVLKNENLKLISFNDYDMNDSLNGKPIYEFKKVDIKKGLFNDEEIETPCVDAVLIANSSLDDDTLDQAADLVLNYTSTLLK